MNAKGIIIWITERVPPPVLMLSCLMYLACQKFSQFIHFGSVQWNVFDLFGAIAMCTYIIAIRSADEHKDFEQDSINFPDRPVQRGVITLGQVKFIGVACLLYMIGVSLYADFGLGLTTLHLFISFVWFYLMTKEFFAEVWLRKHIMVYLVSHQIITPLIILWMMQMGAGGKVLNYSEIWPVLVFVTLSGTIFELARKSWGQEEERQGVDSYTQELGVAGAIISILVCIACLGFTVFYGFKIVTTVWLSSYTIAVFVSLVIAVLACLNFLKSPTRKGRKINEGAMALLILTAHIALILAMSLA